MAEKKEFSNTKSTVKVETGIVTLISYQHFNTFDTGIVNELIHDKN